MKRISTISLALVLLCLMASSAYGQTRGRRTTSSRRARPAATKSEPTASAAAIQTAATRVADQIKSMGSFLYLYGPTWKELQANEAAAQNNPSAAATLQQSRERLRDLFHKYRVQMDELETMFSSSSELRPYYAKLLGAAASAAQAEEAVGAGRYDAAGRTLLEVMKRLTDVLVEMRAR